MNMLLKLLATVGIAGSALALFLWQMSPSQGQEMQKDITLNIGGSLAKDGGLVLVQIIEVDAVAQEEHPSAQELSLSSQVSIVNIPVEKGRDYSYRFTSTDVPSATTNRFSVGTTNLPNDGPKTTLLFHHVDNNGAWSLSYSRRVASVLNAGSAHLEYACQPQHDMLVCDASSVLSGSIPE